MTCAFAARVRRAPGVIRVVGQSQVGCGVGCARVGRVAVADERRFVTGGDVVERPVVLAGVGEYEREGHDAAAEAGAAVGSGRTVTTGTEGGTAGSVVQVAALAACQGPKRLRAGLWNLQARRNHREPPHARAERGEVGGEIEQVPERDG